MSYEDLQSGRTEGDDDKVVSNHPTFKSRCLQFEKVYKNSLDKWISIKGPGRTFFIEMQICLAHHKKIGIVKRFRNVMNEDYCYEYLQYVKKSCSYMNGDDPNPWRVAYLIGTLNTCGKARWNEVYFSCSDTKV